MTSFSVKICPLSAYIEDTYISKLLENLNVLIPTKLIHWNQNEKLFNVDLHSSLICIPEHILWGSSVLAKSIVLQKISIEPLALLLSIHSSVKLYIALDQSPLTFGRFEKHNILTTPYR